jgi:hypothetical protein
VHPQRFRDARTRLWAVPARMLDPRPSGRASRESGSPARPTPPQFVRRRVQRRDDGPFLPDPCDNPEIPHQPIVRTTLRLMTPTRGTLIWRMGASSANA